MQNADNEGVQSRSLSWTFFILKSSFKAFYYHNDENNDFYSAQLRIQGGQSGHGPPSKLAMEFGPPLEEEIMIV